MSLRISNLYLNTLLGGLVVLLTFVLILLYLMQPSNVLASRNTSRVQLTAPSNIDIQGIEKKVGALENLITKEEVRAREQQIAHDQQMDRLKIQITELEIQLEKSKVAEQKVHEQLELEKSLADQLAQQLDSNNLRMQEQQTVQTTTNSKLQALSDSLKQEKLFILSLRENYEKDKVRMLKLTNELDKKKSELVKNKRRLAQNNQDMIAKSRELSISNGRINDVKRRNEALSRKMSILSEEAQIARRRLQEQEQEQEIVARPNSQTGLVN